MDTRWAKVILVITVGLVLVGMGVREYRKSIVSPESRFNLVYIDNGGSRVSVASFDPVEEKVLIIEYPENLEITSRSVGSYQVGSLYKLGSYKEQGGEFARRKVQGFMRLPILGYLVYPEGKGRVSDSLGLALGNSMWKRQLEDNLTLLDAFRLSSALKKYSTKVILEDELFRAGIITRADQGGLSYSPLSLSNYIGKLFFDWRVGKEGVTVSIVNESGESGLGSDMAEFLDNMGLDVITVRSGNGTSEKTKVVISDPDLAESTLALMRKTFTFGDYQTGDTTEYRSVIVVRVGLDALDLF